MTTRRNVLLLPALLAAVVAGGAAEAKNGFCPPGLAKKSPACVPPGQAKKHGYRSLHRGDRIDRYDYSWLRDYDRYGLPRPPRGQRYYVVDDRIYRVDQDTYEILDFVRALGALLD